MTLSARFGVFSAALTLALVQVPDAVQGQGAPLVVEVRGGTAIPLGSFESGSRPAEGAGPGASFGVDFAFSGAGRRTLYVGFSQHRFGCVDAGCDRGGRYVATGMDLGWRVSLRTRGAVVPWIQIGALTTRVEIGDLGGSDAGVTRLGFGGEAGLGLYVGASSAVAFNPGVRITAANSALPGGGLLRLRYVVAELALSVAF